MKSDNITTSFVWKFLERITSQGVNLITQIILARILCPDDFGILAIVLVFVNLANIFTQSGLSAAIIQKKDIDQNDISVTFWLSFFVSCFFYVLIFLFSPLIEKYYQINELSLILRVISISLFFSAPTSLMTGILSRNFEFKKIFFRSLLSVPISGIVGIFMAINGFGVWSLVTQNLINNILTCVVLWVSTKMKIKFCFNRSIIKSIFSFSSKILLANLLINLYESVRSLIIGKKYSTESLAYYDKGQTYTDYAIQSVNSTLSSVLLPIFARKQDDLNSLRDSMSLSISVCSFLVFPLLFGFAAISKSLVIVFLTEKWLQCVPFIIIFCIYRLPYPIFAANQQAYYALGRSDIVLKLEIVRCIINFSILFLTVNLGVNAIAIGMMVASLISMIIFIIPNVKLIKYSLKRQLFDLLLPLIFSVLMFAIVFPLQYLEINYYLLLPIQIIVGICFYLGISFLTKNKNLSYIISKIKKIKNKES